MYVPYNANTSRYTIAVDVASAVINPITLFNTTVTTRAMKIPNGNFADPYKALRAGTALRNGMAAMMFSPTVGFLFSTAMIIFLESMNPGYHNTIAMIRSIAYTINTRII